MPNRSNGQARKHTVARRRPASSSVTPPFPLVRTPDSNTPDQDPPYGDLRWTRSRLAETEALARLGSWEWDVRSNRVLWSDELYRVWGVEAEDLDATYEGIVARVYPDDRDLVRAAVARASREARPYVCEHRIVRQDGAVRWLQSRGAVLADEQGRVIKMFGTGQDITERKDAEQLLSSSRAQLRDFAGRLRSACEKERAAIAREIHDELGQALTALNMDLSSLRKGLSPSARAKIQQETEEMAALIDTMVDKVRNLATELRPAVLDKLGLTAAVAWAVQQFARRTGLHCDLELPAEPLHLDADRSIDVFRILQEALANVARHADASHVCVNLRTTARELILEVHDNGRGIRRSEIECLTAFGLLGMSERALAWGGEIGFQADPDGGTRACIRIPLPPSGSELSA